MPKQRSPNRDIAKQIYLEHKGEISLKEIAEQLGEEYVTVRGWKYKDKWADLLKETFQSKGKKRSNKTPGRAKRSEKNSSNIIPEKNAPETTPDNTKAETNSPKPFARYGNQNAVGNRGGPGGPLRNKYALRTGEYETVFFEDLLNEKEKNILNFDYDKYVQQFLLIDTLTIREKRILFRIKNLENTAGGMVIENVSKTKSKVILPDQEKNGDEPPEEIPTENPLKRAPPPLPSRSSRS